MSRLAHGLQLALLVGAICPVTLGAQQRGLLLGLSSDTTVWLTISDSTVHVTRGVGLYVPRRDGLSRIGTTETFVKNKNAPDSVSTDSSDLGAWYTTGLWVAPVGHTPVTPSDTGLPLDDWATYGGNRSITVTFAGPEYFAVDDDLELDGPMLDYDHTLYIGSLDSLGRHGYTESVPGDRPADRRLTPDVLRRDFNRCVRWSRTHSDMPIDPDAPGTESWGIVREPGHWAYSRRFGFGSGAARGYYTDCAVSIRPSTAFVGRDILTPAWPVIKHRIPSARDAFSSPSGDVLIMLTDSVARVYKLRGLRFDQLLFETPIPTGTVIMAEWATGAMVDDWSRQLRPYLAR